MTTETPPEVPVTALAVRPHDPVGSVSTLRGLLEPRLHSLLAVLPKHVTPERLMKTMLVAVNRTPDLLECTQESVLEAISRGAELGLDLSGTLGEAYLVPFNTKIKVRKAGSTALHEFHVKQCQMIPGYRGLVKLARQSGELRRIEADVVYEKDLFEFERGMSPKCRHVPAIREADRGAVIGAYMVAELTDGFVQIDFMTRAEVEKVRQSSRGRDSLMWTQWWNEGAKKSVIRRGLKLIPMSSEKLHRAIELDDQQYDLDAAPAIDLLPQGKSRSAALADALAIEEPMPSDDEQVEGLSTAVAERIVKAEFAKVTDPATGDVHFDHVNAAELLRLEQLYFNLMPSDVKENADLFGEQYDLLVHDVTGGGPVTPKMALEIEVEIRKRAAAAKPKTKKA